MAYDYLNQNILASALILPHADDSFYNPVENLHNGFAFDGQFYAEGVLVVSSPPLVASWFTEPFGPYRGDTAAFPAYGLVLLSPVSLVILDESIPTTDPSTLTLWMQFLMADELALVDNFNGALNGWTPAALAYADGMISITYIPDEGNQLGNSPPLSPPIPAIDSNMIVTFDFTQDQVYLDVAT